MNIKELEGWIGSSEVTEDVISVGLEKRLRATLDIEPGDPLDGERASSGIHWALAPPIYKHSDLGNFACDLIALHQAPDLFDGREK